MKRLRATTPQEKNRGATSHNTEPENHTVRNGTGESHRTDLGTRATSYTVQKRTTLNGGNEPQHTKQKTEARDTTPHKQKDGTNAGNHTVKKKTESWCGTT